MIQGRNRNSFATPTIVVITTTTTTTTTMMSDNHDMKEIQQTAILGTAHTLRKAVK